MAGQGYEFIIINATTGARTVSPALATNTSIARASGDLTGFYHWSKTLNDGMFDPVAEAEHFAAHSGVKSGDIVALDHEEALGTWAQRVAYAVAWCAEVKQLTGATPLIYVNWSWIKGLRTAASASQWAELTSYPLWLADPSGTPGKHSTVRSQDGTIEDCWPILIHQYAVEPFMGGRLDRNWTPNMRALRKLAKP